MLLEDFWRTLYGQLNASRPLRLRGTPSCTEAPTQIPRIKDRHLPHMAEVLTCYLQEYRSRRQFYSLTVYATKSNPDEFGSSHVTTNRFGKKRLKRNGSLRTRVERDLNAVAQDLALVRSSF